MLFCITAYFLSYLIYPVYTTDTLNNFVLIMPCTEGILVPQPGIEPAIPVMKVQCLNHWTTREVPKHFFK